MKMNVCNEQTNQQTDFAEQWITKQAAIDWLTNEWDGMVTSAFDGIKNLPSAQPQLIKGRWIDVTKTGGAELWKCSECGELELEDSYYCPNCGADMRGEQDG